MAAPIQRGAACALSFTEGLEIGNIDAADGEILKIKHRPGRLAAVVGRRNGRVGIHPIEIVSPGVYRVAWNLYTGYFRRPPREAPRIYTRCPACHNDTLTVNEGHLLCTWIECSDPTLIDRLGNPTAAKS